jgi:hypothetical protein
MPDQDACIYMVMPFIVGIVVTMVGSLVWPHAH